MDINIGARVKITNPYNFYYDSQGTVKLYDEATGIYTVEMDLDKREQPFGVKELGQAEPYNISKHNEHYKKMGIQPFDIVETWELPERVGAYKLQVLKYIMRMPYKEEQLTQAEKALVCCQRLVDTVKRG